MFTEGQQTTASPYSPDFLEAASEAQWQKTYFLTDLSFRPCRLLSPHAVELHSADTICTTKVNGDSVTVLIKAEKLLLNTLNLGFNCAWTEILFHTNSRNQNRSLDLMVGELEKAVELQTIHRYFLLYLLLTMKNSLSSNISF